MINAKDRNSEVDLSKFFDREKIDTTRKTRIQPQQMNGRIVNDKKQGSLVWVVVANFVIGMAIFSYYIIKSNASTSIKPVTIQKIAPPINYTLGEGEQYLPPLP